MIGPAQTKRKIRLTGMQHFLERALQDAPPSEPVVVIAKTFHTVFASQFCLGGTGLGQAQVIEPQICGDMRLIMIVKEWLRFRGAGPFGKPFAPPLVVFGGRVVLGKIESDYTCFICHDLVI